MSVLTTDDWWYFQNHLNHWEREMCSPREKLEENVTLTLAKKHKARVNEILDKLVLILNGEYISCREAYFLQIFSVQANPWRILLPILFYLECERSDVGRLMMADLKFKLADQAEPLFSMTKGFYPSACVICQDPFKEINSNTWDTQKARIYCIQRSCRYEWELMRAAFRVALDGALAINALRFGMRRHHGEENALRLEQITEDTLPKIKEAYAYLMRFFYKHEKNARDLDLEDNETIKRKPFSPRYEKSLSFGKETGKTFWPSTNLAQDPTVISRQFTPTVGLSPTLVDKRARTASKATNRKLK